MPKLLHDERYVKDFTMKGSTSKAQSPQQDWKALDLFSVHIQGLNSTQLGSLLCLIHA